MNSVLNVLYLDSINMHRTPLITSVYTKAMLDWLNTHSVLLLTEFSPMSSGKISTQPHTSLCIQFLDKETNGKNNRFILGLQL